MPHLIMPLLAAAAASVLSTAAADILHVPGDFPTIQEAIDAAVDGDEVEVHPGTYKEAIDFLGKAIRVYSTDGPDVTIIDAQQTGTVVTCESAEGPDSVLEGFTITGGTALNGGGMYNDSSSPTVTNCTFSGNTATGDGGGMDNYFSSPTVTNCTFSGNTANAGGGMYNFSSSPTVTNCTFSGNTANGGGGMYNYLSSPTVTNCSFGGNTATYGGGGIFNFSSSPTVTNCTFSENSAPTGGGMVNVHGNPTVIDCRFSGNSAVGGGGGGMFNADDGSPTVIGCTFSGNSAFFGGGMSNRYNSSPTLTDCTFTGNTAGNAGGGMVNFTGSPTVTNCTFTGNVAGLRGGAMYNASKSDPTVTNCTFSENTAAGAGGGMYSTDEGTNPFVANCILWSNAEGEIIDADAAVTTVSFSDVQDGWPGIGNIDVDPLFVDPDNGDLRLMPGSPCIDAADNTAVPKEIDTDLDGNPRFVDDPDTKDTGFGDPPIVDMGAYEFQVRLCPWDLDGNDVVGASDLRSLLTSWGPCPPKADCPGDFNGDGAVGVSDFLALLANWGPCP